ncbi:NurA domain protein [Pyrolobus fumarii 1A]|uniref:NurA domain protein n=1 Tax=Pyrolobus fumarii (strain DSM 11204 / 1A) TaxID=694429 RepID=G0EDA4_PYRF1|nr:DNA double-strand break repair nuclease NurA [Pyrolobus fumarii]AEM39782.1 NurA domain protein [Pyrolobus fumarii 1A]
MKGDWFIDAYAAVIDRLLSELRNEERQVPEVPTDWWVARLPEPSSDSPPLAAIDGGGGFEPLVGGSALYIARAMAVFNPPGDPVKVVDVKLVPARDTRILDALRSIVEHRAALRALERLPRDEATILMDGSYRAVVSAALSSIRRAAYGHVSLASLYTGLASLELLVVLSKLFQVALEHGVRIAYVSKDSGYRSFKEAVLLDLLSKEAERLNLLDLSVLAERGARSYPLGRIREELLAWRKRVPPRLQSLIDMILDIGYRDTLFIDDFVGAAVGHTLALELALGGLYGSDIEKSVDKLCDRVDEYIGGREAENCRGLRDDAVRAYQMLPAARMMYVRLAPGDDLLLVETPGSSRLASEGRSLEPLNDDEEEVLRVLVAGYAGPRFYNRWLVAAHEAATMRGEHLALYAKLLDSLARARGVRLRLARRVSVGVTGIV